MSDPILTVVHLAGALAVERAGRRATERDLPGRQPRVVFAALVWNKGRTLPHEELAEIVWPGDPPSTWRASLRLLVSKARALFEQVGLPGPEVVASERGSYRLELPEGALVDVEVATKQVEEAERVLAEGGLETARRLAGEARTVLSRPLLAGIDSPWLDRCRDEVGMALTGCLEVLGECRRRAGDHARAAQVIEELLRREPFREPAWRLLMRIHAEAGSVAEALRTYERCRALLADELGTDPSPETQQLHLGLLRGSPAEKREPAEPPAPSHAPSIDGPPYRGLRYFDEDDAPVFFGRDIEIDVLVERLRDHRFVAVVGPSGSGKSSLVRAGLVPALRSGALPDSDTWERILLVPGADPLEALGAAILGARSEPAVEAATKRLGRDEAALHDAAAALLAGRPSGERLLLVVDQFEEIYTLCRDEEARRSFVSTLLDATRRLDARVVLVLTLRSDFYGHAAAYPGLAEAVSTSQVLVPPLDGDGLQLAIEGPARLSGLRFEDGLVGRILADVAGEPGALPLFQHALLALYERRVDHVLTRAAYDDLGGVAGALARRAEGLWAILTAEQREIVRRVMLRLTEPGQQTESTRRRADVGELITDPETGPATEAVIDELTRARLLVASSDPGAGMRSIEIAHEALLGAWPRLAGWIDEDRAGLRIHRRLTEGVGEWQKHDRHPDFLFSGTRLAEARGWASEHEEDLNPGEREFLAASTGAQESAARRRRRLRGLITTALAAGLVVVGVLAMTASAQRGRADREADVARSREVAAEAANQLDLDPELGLLLSIEAYEIAPTAQAEAALRQALVASLLRHRLETRGPDLGVEISPDGKLVASWAFGPIMIWDQEDGRRLAELRDEAGAGLTGAVTAMAFSPESDRLVASNLDGTAWIWSVPDGTLTTTIRWPKVGVEAWIIAQEGARWAPDGSRVVLAGQDGVARIYDPDSAEPVLELTGPGGPGRFLARSLFGPDGELVAVEGADGRVGIVDVETGRTVAETAGHGAPLWAMKLSADGTRLVTAGDDGSARVWDARSGDLLHVLDHDSPVRDAAIDPAGSRVLTGDAIGVAQLWDASSGEVLFDLAGHGSRVNQVRFDAAGRLALTGSLDGTARVWDARTGTLVAAMIGSSDSVIDAEFSPDASFIVTSGDDPRIWQVPQGVVSSIEVHEAPVRELAFTPDGAHMLTGGAFNGIAHTIRLDDGKLLTTVEHALSSVVLVDLSPGGSTVLTTGVPQNPGLTREPLPPRIWEVRTGETLMELPVPEEDPLGVCGGPCSAADARFSPEGDRVAVGWFDGRVGIFETRTAELLRAVDPGEGWIAYVAWGPGGLLVVSAGDDGAFRSTIFDPDTGDVLSRLGGREGNTSGRPRFSPDGRLVATLVAATAQIHDLRTERVVAELRHRGAVRDIAFNRDGTLAVTASESDASIWDLASQRRLVRLPGPGALGVAFTPDGQQIAVGGGDGVVRFYRCEVCRPVVDLLNLARERVTRELTQAERARFLHEDLPDRSEPASSATSRG